MMVFHMKRLIVILCLIFFAVSGYSQVKFEKEERIKRAEAPADAISFVDSMNLNNKVKWYRETGYSTISFEAKTKHKGKRISVEFSENGTFEDIEIEIRTDEISCNAFSKVSDYLLASHEKYKIDKIQIQYSGEPNTVLNYFLTNEVAGDLVINYEVVINTKEDGAFARFEYLFDKDGEFIQKRRIKLSMTDNIEF
ncbi:MAG: hypothetical protein C0593_04185 [Marinilabiliales bacterium]|nr:MAG: hypothetical protein C0593_04185 [Marinilabiliales bacterium]